MKRFSSSIALAIITICFALPQSAHADFCSILGGIFGGGSGGLCNDLFGGNPSSPTAGDPCYFQERDFYNANKQEAKYEKDYNQIMRRYEIDIRNKENASMRVINRISDKDGKLTSLLLQLGVTTIGTLVNKISCDDADFSAFCSQNRGQFYRIAKQYAVVMGQKRGLMQQLESVERIQGGTVLRSYRRAYNSWIQLLYAVNAEGAAYGNLIDCQTGGSGLPGDLGLGDLLGDTPGIVHCDVPGASDISGWLGDLLNSFENDLLGTGGAGDPANIQPGCPPGPEVPPVAINQGDGCFSLLGAIGEAIGATICTNTLIDTISGLF
jgi:hypothetical protein